MQCAKNAELATLINNRGSSGIWGFIKRLFKKILFNSKYYNFLIVI